MSLADRLKIARESLGKGQKEMAGLCNASYRMWQAYESGENQPKAEVIESLVKLGFNANWLLAGEGEMKRGGTGGYVANGNVEKPMEAPEIDVRIQHLYSAFRGDIHKLMVATILVDMTTGEVDALSAWMKDNVTIKERGLLNKG